jgi:hypothetical protein
VPQSAEKAKDKSGKQHHSKIVRPADKLSANKAAKLAALAPTAAAPAHGAPPVSHLHQPKFSANKVHSTPTGTCAATAAAAAGLSGPASAEAPSVTDMASGSTVTAPTGAVPQRPSVALPAPVSIARYLMPTSSSALAAVATPAPTPGVSSAAHKSSSKSKIPAGVKSNPASAFGATETPRESAEAAVGGKNTAPAAGATRTAGVHPTSTGRGVTGVPQLTKSRSAGSAAAAAAAMAGGQTASVLAPTAASAAAMVKPAGKHPTGLQNTKTAKPAVTGKTGLKVGGKMKSVYNTTGSTAAADISVGLNSASIDAILAASPTRSAAAVVDTDIAPVSHGRGPLAYSRLATTNAAVPAAKSAGNDVPPTRSDVRRVSYLYDDPVMLICNILIFPIFCYLQSF